MTTRLGATLFSFTREYLSGEWSLEDCMRAVASLGEGQAVEILDAQHIATYPRLSAESAQTFRVAAADAGVRLSLFGHEVDLGWIDGQPFDDDRIVAVVVQAMEMAAQLGFALFRANMPNPELLRRLLPDAERLGLQLVVELHTQRIDAPETQALIAAFDDWQSPHVGFLPDLGAFTIQVPRAFIAYKAGTGVPERALQIIEQGYNDGRPKGDVAAELRALTTDPLTIETMNECFSMFGRTAPEQLGDLGGHVRHVHTKFYEMIDGEEPCIPYAAVLAELRRMGFTGVLSSEWTGFNFIEAPIVLDQLKAHQEMVARLWQATA